MGGGGSKVYAAPPDYSQLAAASEHAAALGYDLGMQQMDLSRQIYEENKPLIQEISNAQIGIMNQALEQGQDYYDYNKETFRPLEKQIVENAQTFSTDAYKEEQARKAAADFAKANTVQKGITQRQMASMGVNPASGRSRASTNANDAMAAAGRAGAMTSARERSEAMGQAMLMDAAGLGRGLQGASQGAYQVAMQAGNSAGTLSMAPGQQYLAGNQMGTNTIMQGQGLAVSGQQSILSGQTSQYNAALGYNMGQDQLGASNAAGIGSAVGTIAGIALMAMSTKKAKNKTGDVDEVSISKQIERTPIQKWRYKPGIEDGGAQERIGPYAEDMDKMGAAAGGGKMIDIISMLGVTMAGVKGVSKRLSAVEKKLGEGDEEGGEDGGDDARFAAARQVQGRRVDEETGVAA